MAINFPDSPGIGSVFTDSTSGFSYEWNGTLWKSFSGASVSNIQILDDISGSFNNSTTTFNLTVGSSAVSPANAQQIEIILGGIQQSPGVDYTISASTVVYTTAPTSGLTFSGKLLGVGLSLNTIAADTDGSGLTNIPAGELTGTVADARISTLTASKLSGALPAIDGSALTNLVSGVGIKTVGGLVGYGVTFIDFRGSGISTITGPFSGISTINITGSPGGGGSGSIGIQSAGTRVALGITDVNIAIGSTTSRNITGSGTTATVAVDLGDYYIFRKPEVGFATMKVLVAGSGGGIARSDYLGGSQYTGLTTTNTDQFPWVAGIGITIGTDGHLIFTVP